ncbi:MAG: hypothetical protein DMD41_15760 [Gemmatimonadetes bacterium]|nr:MAG: hypothetical protein DMD41_15760 [Gemmatimonadota bacterium]
MTPSWHPSATAGSRADFNTGEFQVARFEQLRAGHPGELLGLSVRVPFELPSRARPTLIVERDSAELVYSPRLSSSCRLPARDTGDWLWRCIFSVPPELSSDPCSLFALQLYDDFRVALPLPSGVLQRQEPAERGRIGTVWPYAMRRGALLLVVTCQLCLAPAWLSPGALAAEAPGSGTTVEPAPERPSPPQAEKPTEPAPEKQPVQPAGPTPGTLAAPPAAGTGEPAPRQAREPPAQAKRESTTSGAEPNVVKLSVSEEPFTSAAGTATSSPSRLRARPKGNGPAGAHADKGAANPRRHPGQGAGHRRGLSAHHAKVKARPAGSLRAAPTDADLPAATAPAPDFSEVPPVLFRLPPGLEGLGEDNPPGYLIPIYEEAGRRYDVPWQVLAGINEIETDYGRNLSVSSAGAVGWMQFMPETWSRWAVDANHDGKLNPYSPLDAIFTAARYLQASGASTDLPAAIYAYNHADWYVTEVLLRARSLARDLASTGSEKGYSLPLDTQYMAQLGRTDDGVDIEIAPDGALVYSITPGIVSAVASDPAGFGPNYPVVEATRGTLAGQHIYYGHVALALVRPGERVTAGQPLAVMGHTGDAATLGHGHIEIGFSDAGGNPLSHHGVEAWTPAGDIMRGFLLTLSHDLRTHHARSRPPLRLTRHARPSAAGSSVG